MYRVSVSRSSLTQVSSTMARMNCAVSRRSVSRRAVLLVCTVCALCFVLSFCERTDDGRGIVVYCCIVCSHPRRFKEFCAVVRGVCYLQPNEAEEVVHSPRFIVRDLKEERCHDLPDLREVGVGRLPVDQLEFLERIGEFCHNFLGRHFVWRWRLFVIFRAKCRLRGLK